MREGYEGDRDGVTVFPFIYLSPSFLFPLSGFSFVFIFFFLCMSEGTWIRVSILILVLGLGLDIVENVCVN